MNDRIFGFDSTPTTTIGSLPCREPEEALDLLDRYPLAIPSWPQLPKRSFREGMVFQCTEGFPGIRVDDAERKIWVEHDDDLPGLYAEFYERVFSGDDEPFAMSPETASGLAAFLDRRGKEGRKLPAVKGQLAGPFTVGLSLADQSGKSTWFDEQYRDVLIKALTRKALWQAGRLAALADQVVLFFDEPIFAALGTPAYIGIGDEDVVTAYTAISDEVRASGAAVGIHCCGNMDWSLPARTSADIISFDAYSFGAKVALYAGEIDAFLRRGGWLAWGLVPTGDAELAQKESADSLKRKRDQLVALFEEKGVERDLLLGRMLITPSCGMGTLPLPSAERVLDLLGQLRDTS